MTDDSVGLHMIGKFAFQLILLEWAGEGEQKVRERARGKSKLRCHYDHQLPIKLN